MRERHQEKRKKGEKRTTVYEVGISETDTLHRNEELDRTSGGQTKLNNDWHSMLQGAALDHEVSALISSDHIMSHFLWLLKKSIVADL
jgi:hypothetical protein